MTTPAAQGGGGATQRPISHPPKTMAFCSNPAAPPLPAQDLRRDASPSLGRLRRNLEPWHSSALVRRVVRIGILFLSRSWKGFQDLAFQPLHISRILPRNQVGPCQGCNLLLLGQVEPAVAAAKKVEPNRQPLPPACLCEFFMGNFPCHSLAFEPPHLFPLPSSAHRRSAAWAISKSAQGGRNPKRHFGPPARRWVRDRQSGAGEARDEAPGSSRDTVWGGAGPDPESQAKVRTSSTSLSKDCKGCRDWLVRQPESWPRN